MLDTDKRHKLYVPVCLFFFSPLQTLFLFQVLLFFAAFFSSKPLLKKPDLGGSAMLVLWSCVFVLAVGSSLGKVLPSSAAIPEDCHESHTTSLSLDNTTQFAGRWNFMEGFSDHNDFVYLLNWTQSSWIDFKPSDEDNRTLTMVAHERMNGICTVDLFNVTITSNFTMDVSGNIIESKFNLLSTCDDCLVVNITTTKRCDKSDNPPVHHSLYILSRGQSLNQTDLEVFHHQARCMNFSLPPDFHYDHKQEFCPEHMEAPVEKPENSTVTSRWDTKTVCN